MYIKEDKYKKEIDKIVNALTVKAMIEFKNDRIEAHEFIHDVSLSKELKKHTWIKSHALDVIAHTDNEDYYNDNFGGECLENSLKEGGLSALHSHIAFWAMYADVSDKINDALDAYEEEV